MKEIFISALLIILLACNNKDTANQKSSAHARELKGDKHFISGHPVFTTDSLINVVVEIPAGTLEKWEVDKSTGTMKLTQQDNRDRIVQYLPYPSNYGLIPQTLLPKEQGGDGDPLDVFILGASVERGSVLPGRLIGVIEMLDNGEQDDKLVAVSSQSPFKDIKSIEELKQKFPGTLEILSTWLGNYKGPGVVQVKTIADEARAREILLLSMQGYKNK